MSLQQFLILSYIVILSYGVAAVVGTWQMFRMWRRDRNRLAFYLAWLYAGLAFEVLTQLVAAEYRPLLRTTPTLPYVAATLAGRIGLSVVTWAIVLFHTGISNGVKH